MSRANIINYTFLTCWIWFGALILYLFGEFGSGWKAKWSNLQGQSIKKDSIDTSEIQIH